MLNFVHPDEGKVEFFGQDFSANELEIKQRISFTFGGVNLYLRTPMHKVTEVYKRFFDQWDDAAYRKYLQMFELVES